MGDIPTVGDLLKAKAITTYDIDDLFAAYQASPRTGLFPLGDTYWLDVEKAINAQLLVVKAINGPASPADWRTTLIRTAITLARPEKA